MLPKESFAVPRHEIVQSHPSMFAKLHDALIFAMINNLPTLGVVVPRADLFSEYGFQTASTPDVLTKNRLKS